MPMDDFSRRWADYGHRAWQVWEVASRVSEPEPLFENVFVTRGHERYTRGRARPTALLYDLMTELWDEEAEMEFLRAEYPDESEGRLWEWGQQSLYDQIEELALDIARATDAAAILEALPVDSASIRMLTMTCTIVSCGRELDVHDHGNRACRRCDEIICRDCRAEDDDQDTCPSCARELDGLDLLLGIVDKNALEADNVDGIRTEG